jgi:multidrug efflux pump subunit AcrA (membrane-fusion protein)
MPGITGTINRIKMKNISLLLLTAAGLSLFVSCGNKTTGNAEELVVPKAAVTTTSLKKGRIEEQITLNGKTVFLKKNEVVAPISGYLTAVNVKFGDKVETGKVLFEIQTRENKALQQSETGNSNSNNYGKITVKATTSGIVNEPLVLGTGVYVSQGNILCTLADNNDLLVRVNVPFEYHKLIQPGTRCRLWLPDNTLTDGTVYRVRPFVDETSQTQEVLVKPAGNHTWPENMNLTVSFLKDSKDETMLLPKKALLTNETQSKFWVMKIVQDSIAIEIPVQTGIKNDSIVEILPGKLSINDKIILEGGYGLADSSVVKIVK